MADEPRRVRTQAERDADGQAWRRTAATRPGYATYPQTAPGSPSWWRHDPYRSLSPVARVMAYPDGPPPVDGETCKRWCGFCHLGTGEHKPEMPATMRQRIDFNTESELDAPMPRRRWWHRLTRRGL